MSERFHIGALARACGQSVHAIRWYEGQGLIPNVGRDTGGRRVYVQGHVEHLRFLDRLKRTGMTIAQMRHYCALSMAGWRSLPERKELLAAHRARIEAAIEELGEVLTLIDEKAAYYEAWMANKKRPPDLAPAGPPKARVRISGPG